ncbi:MAG: DUF4274 domain-containing protein [Oscillospiraceae bacterium]|nr:DUF4274 domain-containing protein [Oscillospiraceae bacterium]
MTKENIIELLDNKSKNEIIAEINKTENSEMLHLIADNYNWDKGFEIPNSIIDNKYCDLGTALMLFYDADGYSVLENKKELENTDLKDWAAFIAKLLEKISSDEFTKKHIKYVPPLSKVQIFKMKRYTSIDRIFIDGTDGE